MYEIAFPGLGIAPFHIDPVAFTLFGKDIMWYGIIISVAILCALAMTRWRTKYEGFDEDSFFDIAIFTVLFGIVGARLYYVIFYGGFVEKGGTFFENLGGTLYNIIAVWEGGLAIYGGIIAGALTIAVFGFVKKLNIPKFLDGTAPSVLLAQGIGRWGNFMNAEAHGGETDIFCRMGIRYTPAGEMLYYHPTFFYESLWNIIGVIILTALYKKKKFNGQITLGYFFWYGLGRMIIEGMRTDSLMIGPFRVSQLLAGVLFVVSGALLLIGLKYAEKIPALRLAAPSGCEARIIAQKEKEEQRRAKIEAKKTTKANENTDITEEK